MTKHYSKFTNNYTKIYYKDQLISEGIRDPLTRIKHISLDFNDKTVLDIGCNCGGTLFSIADKIKFGYGCDINPFAIDFANGLIKQYNIKNLNFKVADLSKWQDYNLPKTDIVFALAIAKWIQPWREIIKYVNAPAVIFETHGKGNMQPEQVNWLKENYNTVELLLENYEEGKRKLYLCKK